MAVSNTTLRSPASGGYACNGSVTDFAGAFRLLAEADVSVILRDSEGNETTLVLGAGADKYTVAPTGGAYPCDAFTVTTGTTYASGNTITLIRSMDLTQPSGYGNQGPYLPHNHETSYDRNLLLIQQQQEEIDRCVKDAPSGTSVTDPDSYLAACQAAQGGAETAETGAEASETVAAASLAAMQAAGYYLSEYASLSAAITAIGAMEAELIIDQDDTMAGSLTVPSNITLRFIKGNTIDTSTSTLTVNGVISAGHQRLFATGSTVDLSGIKNESALVGWFGAVGDGSTDDVMPLTELLTCGALVCQLEQGKTYITSDELSPVASSIFDLNNAVIKADPDLPNTSNIIIVEALNITVKNGEIDGNRANLNNVFSAGSYGNGVRVTDGGDGARIISVITHDCPTNGQAVISSSAAIDDVKFINFDSYDNAFTGTGGESQSNGNPITGAQFINGRTSGNDLGGGIRIQGLDNYLIDGHIEDGSDHGGVVIGPGEAYNTCRGSVVNSYIENTNAGLATFEIDAKVGGAGPNAGKIATVEVNLDNVELVGSGTGSGLVTRNGALVTGGTVISRDHTNNGFFLTESLVIFDTFISKNSVTQGIIASAVADIRNLIITRWGATSPAVTFNTGSDGSVIKGRFGATIEESGTHDGPNNQSVMTDSTASFVADEHIGKVIRNTTDGSKGTITANTATTVTATLAGGTDNDWDTSDTYEITAETGKDGVSQSGSPSNIELHIRTFTGTGLDKGLVSGATANTWMINNQGALNMVEIEDGIAAPSAEIGRAKMYINASNGDLEIIFGDGTTKTIVIDT